MLRAIPNKLGGVFVMVFSIIILLFVPLLGSLTSVRSSDFRPIFKVFFWFFIFSFLLLGWLGACPVEEPYIFLSRLLTFYYFLFFLFLMPLIGFVESYLLKLALRRRFSRLRINKKVNSCVPSGLTKTPCTKVGYFLTRYDYHKRH